MLAHRSRSRSPQSNPTPPQSTSLPPDSPSPTWDTLRASIVTNTDTPANARSSILTNTDIHDMESKPNQRSSALSSALSSIKGAAKRASAASALSHPSSRPSNRRTSLDSAAKSNRSKASINSEVSIISSIASRLHGSAVTFDSQFTYKSSDSRNASQRTQRTDSNLLRSFGIVGGVSLLAYCSLSSE